MYQVLYKNIIENEIVTNINKNPQTELASLTAYVIVRVR
jgi:hypothetical protein